jgi:hypothetical protein
MNRDSDNKEDCQQEPQSDERYVILPGHPFYGQRFKVLSRHNHKTYVRCVIETPQQPGFQYQIMERWLSANPPSLSAQSSVVLALPLSTLDKMVQMILTITQKGQALNNAQGIPSTSSRDLASTATTKTTPTLQPTLPSSIEGSERTK